MWLRNPLDDLLSSHAKVAALRTICLSTVPLNGREIARRAGISSGMASRVLGELVASGAVVSRDQGRANTYELGGSDVALVKALCDLFSLEEQRRQQVVDELVRGVPGVLSLVLFGSEARSEARPGSDTDLLIVVEDKAAAEATLSANALRIASSQLLALSWHLCDREDLGDWDQNENPLWHDLLTDGVCLRGTPLERLRRQWQRGKAD
jgi:predicted nucleotidyltransferase